MRKYRDQRTRTALFLLAVACTSTAALAASPPSGPPPLALGQPASTEQLRDMTGGSDTTNNINQQTLNGTMSDTEARDTVSGSNVVSGSAFGSSAGLPTVIQNSGNNVLIQNATIVNVRMNP